MYYTLLCALIKAVYVQGIPKSLFFHIKPLIFLDVFGLLKIWTFVHSALNMALYYNSLVFLTGILNGQNIPYFSPFDIIIFFAEVLLAPGGKNSSENSSAGGPTG